MSKLLDFTQRRPSLIRCTLFTVLLLAFSLFVLFVHDGALFASKDGSKFDLKKRNGFPYYPLPCYDYDSRFICRPTLFLVGIQFAGLEMLREALELHPDIDTYSTGFFNLFDDVTGVLDDYNNQEFYHSLFKKSTKKIENDSSTLTICDSGHLLARTYDLRVNDTTGEVLPPEGVTSLLLYYLYGTTKQIIFTVLDPTVRFVREYCSRRIADNFDDYVDQSIADYLACENNATRNNDSCVYDASLSGLLQAGLYDFLIGEDLVRAEIDEGTAHAVFLKDLEDPATRIDTMIAVFDFLGKDYPEPPHPYWTALDALFNRTTGCCFGQTISDEAKGKLNSFYNGRATPPPN